MDTTNESLLKHLVFLNLLHEFEAAAVRGDLEAAQRIQPTLEELQSFCQEVSYRRKKFSTTVSSAHPMFHAAETGDLATLQKWLQLCHPDALADGHQLARTALQYAAGHNQVEAVKLLLTAGADALQSNRNCLIWAVESGAFEILQLLKDRIPNLQDLRLPFPNALKDAFSQDDHATMRRWLELLGPDSCRDSHPKERTLFQLAIGADDFETAKLCLEFGADPNLSNSNALQWALENKSLKAVEFLLEHDITIPMTDRRFQQQLKDPAMPAAIVELIESRQTLIELAERLKLDDGLRQQCFQKPDLAAAAQAGLIDSVATLKLLLKSAAKPKSAKRSL